MSVTKLNVFPRTYIYSEYFQSKCYIHSVVRNPFKYIQPNFPLILVQDIIHPSLKTQLQTLQPTKSFSVIPLVSFPQTHLSIKSM